MRQQLLAYQEMANKSKSMLERNYELESKPVISAPIQATSKETCYETTIKISTNEDSNFAKKDKEYYKQVWTEKYE